MRLNSTVQRERMRLAIDMSKTQALVLFAGALLLGGILIWLGSMPDMTGSVLIVTGALAILGLSLATLGGEAKDNFRQGSCRPFSLKGLKWALFTALSAAAIGGVITLLLNSIQQGIFWASATLIFALLVAIFQAILIHGKEETPVHKVILPYGITVVFGGMIALIALFGSPISQGVMFLLALGMSSIIFGLTVEALFEGLPEEFYGFSPAVSTMATGVIILLEGTTVQLLVWAAYVFSAIALTYIGVAAWQHVKRCMQTPAKT